LTWEPRLKTGTHLAGIRPARERALILVSAIRRGEKKLLLRWTEGAKDVLMDEIRLFSTLRASKAETFLRRKTCSEKLSVETRYMGKQVKENAKIRW